MSDVDKSITAYRCPVCDVGFKLKFCPPAGNPYYYCDQCMVGARTTPQLSGPYSPQLGFEALRSALNQPGSLILEAVAGFILESVRNEEDNVIVYGSGDSILVSLLLHKGVQALGYEPRADYWPAIKQYGGDKYTTPILTGAEQASVKIFVGLDDLWMENAPHILSWFQPEVTIVSPPIYLQPDPTPEQFAFWCMQQQAKYSFTPESFANWVDVLFPPPYEPQIDLININELNTSMVRITDSQQINTKVLDI